MIMSKNDDTILALKEKIEKQKKELGAKFVPITNCSLELNGVRYNIHTLNSNEKNTIMELLIKLNSQLDSAIQLGFDKEYKISGFTIYEWIVDLTAKMKVVSVKDKERELKTMEAKLDTLLSTDKKTELELQAIMDAVGGL
jgi:hypothetical protein